MADGGTPAKLRLPCVVQCSPCRHCNAPCAPGLAFLTRLDAAIALTPVGGEFELIGSASLCCGTRLCPVVWRATAEGTRLWGDVAPEVPVAVLLGSGSGAHVPVAAEIVTEIATGAVALH